MSTAVFVEGTFLIVPVCARGLSGGLRLTACYRHNTCYLCMLISWDISKFGMARQRSSFGAA